MNADEVVEMVTQVLNTTPALLGTFTLPGGSVIPAVGKGDIVPDDWEVQGLAVVVPFVPESDNLWTSRVVRKTQTWDLILIQHETASETQNIGAAIARLERFFPFCTTVPLPALGEFGNLPQCRITFGVFDTQNVLNKVYIGAP